MATPKRVSIRSILPGQQLEEPPASQAESAVPAQSGGTATLVPPAREIPTVNEQSVSQAPAEQAPRVKTGFTLRKDLLKAVRRLAVEEEVDINDLLEEAMLLLLENRHIV